MRVTKFKNTIKNILFMGSAMIFSQGVLAIDLQDIKKQGVLRHIGVPYANFVSYIKKDDFELLSGMDVELVKGFAEYLGVEYQYVPAKWNNVIGKLTGQHAQFENNKTIIGDECTIEGDIIANGVTILDWRAELADFSNDYFPSAVWLVARADSDLHPIQPTNSIDKDIKKVKLLINGRDVLAMEHSCLDPNLYNLYSTGANIILPATERSLNEMVPAILNKDAESTLLDVADTLIALEKWPGEIKVIGPVSQEQRMGAVFRKSSPELRKAFNQYLDDIKKDGTYLQLVEKYYPSVSDFYRDYFNHCHKLGR
ncbi:transporter substrate-binding domain-containing protein [Moritella sp. JT01]|uniref:transporter substrate-binding domain-containing protein n=1 Tax=Moritella sp. JT01 TaxID=756698 RepID=UPI00082BC096|nr:transporter substrate-binding domain-containing protein [Moritella sp. JT01]